MRWGGWEGEWKQGRRREDYEQGKKREREEGENQERELGREVREGKAGGTRGESLDRRNSI